MVLSPMEFVICFVLAMALLYVRLPQMLNDQGLYLDAARVQAAGIRTARNGLLMISAITLIMALIRASV